MLNINEKMLWPKINEKFLFEENIKFIIQINGKTKKIIISNTDTREDFLLEKIKNDNKLNNFLKHKNIQKKILIPKKIKEVYSKDEITTTSAYFAA